MPASPMYRSNEIINNHPPSPAVKCSKHGKCIMRCKSACNTKQLLNPPETIQGNQFVIAGLKESEKLSMVKVLQVGNEETPLTIDMHVDYNGLPPNKVLRITVEVVD